jgi:hypothetical protein
VAVAQNVETFSLTKKRVRERPTAPSVSRALLKKRPYIKKTVIEIKLVFSTTPRAGAPKPRENKFIKKA